MPEPYATITLNIDPQLYEELAGESVVGAPLYDLAQQVNQDASHILGYVSWEAHMPGEELTLPELADLHDILAYIRGMSVPVLPYLSRDKAMAQVEQLRDKLYRLAGIPNLEE